MKTTKKPLYGTIAQTGKQFTITYEDGSSTTGYSRNLLDRLPAGAPILDFSQLTLDEAYQISRSTPADLPAEEYIQLAENKGVPVTYN